MQQDVRVFSIAYYPSGLVSSTTDPLGRMTTYTYDTAGRRFTQTLPGPDLRAIAYDYDNDDNLSSVSPPSRPAHTFIYDGTDRQTDDTAPDVGAGTRVTHTTYNQDHQPIQVDRPGAQDLSFSYDSAGRLQTITQPAGQTLVNYDAQTANVSDVTAYSGVRTDFHYDGSLATGEDHSGPITGSTSRTYNNDFQVASTSVNGANTVSYGYHQDGLLTSAGTLTLQRSAQNGLLEGTTQGQLQVTIDRDGFGSPQGLAVDYASTTLFTQIFTRDDGGRITEKEETTDQGTRTYVYTYHPASGRLIDVTKNGNPQATYDYDQNGNRTSVTKPGQGTTIATHDAQDRLLTNGTKSYSYTLRATLPRSTTARQARRRPTTTTPGALTHVSLPSGIQIDYVTDARGRRVAKKRNGILEQGFLYEGSAIGPVAELDALGLSLAASST